MCQIDHVLVNKTMNALIENYQVDNATATSSDNSAIKNTLRIRVPLKRQNLKKKTNWYEFRDKEIRDIFNLKLQNSLHNCVDLGCSDFCVCVMGAAKEVSKEFVKNTKVGLISVQKFYSP